MSMLPPEIHAELDQLLQALQSPDNNVRSQAEDHLANNWTATRPDLLLMGLAEQLAASTNASVSHIACPVRSPTRRYEPMNEWASACMHETKTG